MKLIPLLLLSLILFSCSKSNNDNSITPPNNNTPKDSLFAWKSVGSITSPDGISDIWFTSPSKGFAAVSDGYLYQSLDSGKTWTKIPNSFSSSTGGMSNLFFVDATYGFAQGTSQLQVTKDGGNTWSLQSLPTATAYNLCFTSPSTGYYGDITAGLYKTTDTGKTWTRTMQSTTLSRVDYPMFFLSPDKGFVLSGDAVLLKTIDGAASWQQVQQNIFVTSNSSPAFNTLQFIDSLTGFYASSYGVLKTIDGGHMWKNINPDGSSINVVKFFNATTGYFKTNAKIYKTTDGGQTWTTSCKFITGDIIIGMYFLNGATGWACTAKGLVLRIDQP